MKKKFFFLAGLPRSGSTLLSQLLCQRPDVYATGTSGILGMMLNVRNFWGKVDEFKALDPKVSDLRRVSTMRGMLEGFFDDVLQPIVIDKSRLWPAHLEMAEAILGEKPKVIVTVRDIRDVLASFEKKWREAKVDTLVAQEEGNSLEYQDVAGRCRVLVAKNQLVGSAVVTIRDAVARGWHKQMLFVEYEKLCDNPKKSVSEICDFLEIGSFEHDMQNVETKVVERDETYGWKNLHKIRPVIQPQVPQWPTYIPEVAEQYKAEAYFWRNL